MSNSSPRTILIIEDDPDILFATSECVESEGYRVHTAANGLEALECIEQKGLPDLILLDMRMPVMDGWAFAAEFRAKYGTSVPLVVMTAAADVERRASEIQADAWLGKPFQLDPLLKLLREQLGS